MVLKGLGAVYIDDLTLEEQPACPDVRHLTLTGQTASSATFGWSDDGAGTYQVETRQGDSVLPATTVSDTTTTIEGLELDNDYEVYVRAVCDSSYGEWSDVLNVHIGYCQPNPTSRDRQGLTGIVFGGMVNDSIHPQAAPYYGDYSAMQGSVAAGTTANIDITYATGYTYGTVIWVDWNRSMSFEADEIVWSGMSTNVNPTTLNASFRIPATQDTGSYRMRIAGADSH